jgi:hypothetical protein
MKNEEGLSTFGNDVIIGVIDFGYRNHCCRIIVNTISSGFDLKIKSFVFGDKIESVISGCSVETFVKNPF